MAAGILLDPERLAFDHVLEPDLAGDFGQDRDRVGIPLDEDRTRLDLLILRDPEDAAGRNLELLQLVSLGVDDRELAVAGQHDRLALFVLHGPQAGELHRAGSLGLVLALLDRTLADATNVEGPHRELRAWLSDALGGNDADRHALFNE